MNDSARVRGPACGKKHPHVRAHPEDKHQDVGVFPDDVFGHRGSSGPAAGAGDFTSIAATVRKAACRPVWLDPSFLGILGIRLERQEIAVRPHVELIQESDLCWHAAELPKGEGKVRQRNLSFDEENGAGSTKLIFDSAWHRPAGYHDADTEWYVLVRRNPARAGNCSERAPISAPRRACAFPAMSVKEGTEVLLFRELKDWGFSVSAPGPTRLRCPRAQYGVQRAGRADRRRHDADGMDAQYL